jgi:signal transduction histidine kinase/DNA-binding response OmpR family regulator/HPt (histidine-containing phosphotransfer) domain-containing protein
MESISEPTGKSRWRMASLCALGVALIGVVVLLGWTVANNTLISFIPGTVPMNPLVAVLFLLCAVALALQPPARRNRRLVPWIAAGAAVTIILAAARLWRYLTGAPLYVDRWLFAARLNHVPFAPNRMAPETATAFIVAGLGLLAGLSPRRRLRQWWVQAFGLTVLLVVIFGLTSHLFGLTNYLFGGHWSGHHGRFMPMPFDAALGFLLLTAGLLSLEPNYGLSRNLRSPLPGGMIMRRLLPAVLLLPPALIWPAIVAFRMHLIGAGVAAGLVAIVTVVMLGGMVWGAAIMIDKTVQARHETIEKLQIAQRALIQARATAEEATRVKGQFLANMSHEIRTPLHGVTTMLDLLSETPLTRQQTNYTHIARSSADALLSVINDVLDFSKIEAGRLELNIQDFDLRVATENTVFMLTPIATAKGLDVICRIAPDLPSLVRGDPARLRQVLINLINNAIKFTDAGEIAVKVAPALVHEHDMVVRFEVHDTGIGIPPEHGRRLFTAFTQVRGGGDKFHGGTGLGLAICKQLVEMMGGVINYESQPGHGSCFWFTVKLQRQPNIWLDAETLPEALRTLRVLLVIPSAAVREALAEQLTYWRLTVRQADTIETALQHLRQMQQEGAPADILFADHQSSTVDALELLRRVRGQADLKKLATVLLTRAGAELPPQLLRAHGIASVLNKPIRQSQLFDALMQILGDGGAHRDASRTEAAPRPALRIRPELKGLKILVAEDNEINQFVAREVLHGLQLSCQVVNNGRVCLQTLEKEPFDLVLMDNFMPVLSGCETVREIRRREAAGKCFTAGGRGKIPIIILTANANPEDRRHCHELGADGYLIKPLDRAALVKEIESLMAPNGSPAAADAGPTVEPAALVTAAAAGARPAGTSVASASARAGPRPSESGQAGKPTEAPAAPAEPVGPLPAPALLVAQADNRAKSEEPIDLDRLLSYCGQDRQLVERLLQKFLPQGRQELAHLTDRIAAGDWEAAARAAHQIKGTAAYLFAQPLHLAAERLEMLCRGSLPPAGAAAALAEVTTQMQRCLEWIDQHRADTDDTVAT